MASLLAIFGNLQQFTGLTDVPDLAKHIKKAERIKSFYNIVLGH